MMLPIKAFAPVNIAWIKYMGKDEQGLPSNSSLSLTLSTLGTTTELQLIPDTSFKLEWDPTGYVPPLSGQKKAENFLLHSKLWDSLLSEFGFNAKCPEVTVKIKTQNNIPAGTGIATSASGFAALTLAWSALLAGERANEWIKKYESGDAAFRRAIARVAAAGSGSACRSLDGPWVEWNADGIQVIDGGEQEWVDFIFILESESKAVSSSEAHQRVKTSPNFFSRADRVLKRLTELKSLLKNSKSISQLHDLVLDEAMDMHQLFHTSVPSFRYMNPMSEELISQFKNTNTVLTLDAGANVHLFVPIEDEQKWESFIQKKYPHLKYVKDVTGYGAHYHAS